MKTIEIDNGCKIFSWCPEIEDSAMEQMKVLAQLPFVKYACLMPDAHLGQNMPIGGVIACENVVIPDSVGVDIGCGMGAVKTNLHKSELDNEDIRKQILHSLSRGIPVGFNHNSTKRIAELKETMSSEVNDIVNALHSNITLAYQPISNVSDTIYSQLGSLGGGNHFCEIQYDENDTVWFMLHSGSRNIGKVVGDYFNEIAKDLNAKWHSKSTIPFLPTDTDEGASYLSWMIFALNFAYLNRKVMLNEVKKTFVHMFPNIQFITDRDFTDSKDSIINIHHNFSSLENHMGRDYWIHRKGATMARKDMTGIIPGSMGTSSYIVKGLGNVISLNSCSHGAGRKMGRMEYSRLMKDNYAEVEKSLEGVVHSDFSKFDRGKMKGILDVSESPGAYKNIDLVMSNQVDLVTPIVKLKPLICLKG